MTISNTAYATQTDLTTVGMPTAALATLTTTQINQALIDASAEADTYFRARYGNQAVPLVNWDRAVTIAVAKIATYYLVRLRGFRPDSTADQRFKEASNEGRDWLMKVQRQQAHPAVTLANGLTAPAQPNLTTSSVVNVVSGATATRRGW